MLLLLLVLPFTRVPASCEPKRERALRYLFDEVHTLTGGDEITYEMMERYERRMPGMGRWMIRRIMGHSGGINYILGRCRGDDGAITYESSVNRHETCISKCLFATVLTKFLDWGYADYWKT